MTTPSFDPIDLPPNRTFAQKLAHGAQITAERGVRGNLQDFGDILRRFKESMNPVRPAQPGPNILSSGPVTMPASAKAIANNMSTKQLLQGVGPGAKSISTTVPGAAATKTVLNKPGMVRNLKAFGKGLGLGTAMGKGNLAVTGLSLAEEALINSGTEYGNKVKAARDQREGAKDQIAELGVQGIIDSALRPMGVIGAPKQASKQPAKQSAKPMYGTVSGDVSLADYPEGVPLPKRMADIRGSKTPGSMEPAETNVGEAKAMASAEASRPGAGYPMGVDKPLDYATVANTGGGMPAGTPVPNMTYESFMRDIGTGRESDLPFNAAAGRDIGLNVRNPFESTNLPGTKKAEGEIPLQNAGETPEGTEISNAIKGNEDDSRALNLDPGTEMGTDEGKASRRRASRAFLDSRMGSMRALRAAEAEMGLVSQGGRKFIRKGDELVGITRDQYRARMDGGDIEAIFGENKAGAGPVAEISAKPIDYKANASLQSGVKAESDAYIPPSDSQNPVVQNTDYTPVDGEIQLQTKAGKVRNMSQSRLRQSFR